MTEANGPSRHLSLFLLKRGTELADAVREPGSLERREVSVQGLGVEAVIFTKETLSSVPWWVAFLDPLTEDDLRAASSRTTSAVLVIRLAERGRHARTVCFTFGYGRHLLDPGRVERDFGLRLALNVVDPARLRGFDTRRQEDVVVHSRVQTSAGTELVAFDVNEYRDIFRSAAGITRDEHSALLGSMVRGSVGVTFDVPIEASHLADRAKALLTLYRRDTYREEFSFIDRIRPVDVELVEPLDALLEQALVALDADGDSPFRCLYLAVPEVIDLEATEGFSYSSERGTDPTIHPDLVLTDYLATRRGRSSGIGVTRTRSDRIKRRVEGQVDRPVASVYRCLVGEVDHDGATYQLVDGQWYVIDDRFVERIRGELAGIPLSEVVFPEMNRDEREEDYNARAAEVLHGICLDARNVPIGGGHNRIEVCDVALPNRQLVFTKKRSKSSILSHLWFQATVSVRALVNDAGYREGVRQRIAELDPAFVDLAADGTRGSDVTVHYLILGVDPRDPVGSIPFFSQVALWQAWSALRSMGASVRVAGVPLPRAL